MTCRVYVRHQIHFPDFLPHVVWRIEAATDADAGVRAEQIDRPVVALGGIDECSDIGFATDIDTHPRATQLRCDSFDAGVIQIRDGNMTRTFPSEATRECATDALRAACDCDDLARNLH